MAPNVVVATHGHCFDGLCSAVLFTRLMHHIHGSTRESLRFIYRAMGYGPGQNGVEASALSGDINAILDFRFSASDKLNWYFDHHVSAFPSPVDKDVYEAHVAREGDAGSSRRMFHDGAYGSCTKLIADVGARQFGLNPEPMANLVRWADLIDTASFSSAKMAVERAEPVLQLMTVIEHFGDDSFLERMVPRLLNEPLEDVARGDDIVKLYAPLREGHEAFIQLVHDHARVVGDAGAIVVVDLADQILEVAGKFVTYALYPESAYSIILSRSKSKCKLSIGYNPWSPKPRRHHIASICERFGGGGHPVVGAISLPANDVEGARSIVQQVVESLLK